MSNKVLVFSGSARTGSLNQKLAMRAAQTLQELGAETTLINLKDFPMPLYNGDEEAESGVPENALKLRAIFKTHDALVIASPENNASVSALLKNTLDWLSRSTADEDGLLAFRDKTALLLAASPGMLGGLRGLNHLRDILHTLTVLTLPATLALSKANEAFADDGRFNNAVQQQKLQQLCQQLLNIRRNS